MHTCPSVSMKVDSIGVKRLSVRFVNPGEWEKETSLLVKQSFPWFWPPGKGRAILAWVSERNQYLFAYLGNENAFGAYRRAEGRHLGH